MKSITLAIFAIITFNCYSQTWPKAKTSTPTFDKWMNYKGYTMIMHDLSPVSIADAIDETKDLLLLIDASYNSPTANKSIYYRENATEIDNLSSFYVDASIDFSRLNKCWIGYDKTGKKYWVMIATTKNSIAVSFTDKNKTEQ